MYMVAATLVFTCMIAMVRIVRQDLSAWETIAWRGLVTLPLAAWWCRKHGYVIRRRGLMLTRSLLGFSAMTCFFVAAKGLPVVDISLVSKIQPLLVALVAVVTMGASERPGRSVLVALVFGAAGCLFLLGPDLGEAVVPYEDRWHYGWFAVASAVCSALAHVTVRALVKTERPASVVFWFQAIVMPLSLLFAFGFGELQVLPSGFHMMLLFLIGVGSFFGQLLMTKGYALDRAAAVASASYTQPVFALAIDLLVFGVTPSLNAWVGGALIVFGGLWLLRAR